MGGLSAQKGGRVRRRIVDVGADLGLPPPSSPDPNAIEMTFSPLQARLCEAGERTVADRRRRMGPPLKDISLQTSGNDFIGA